MGEKEVKLPSFKKELPQPSIEKLAAAINKYLVPAYLAKLQEKAGKDVQINIIDEE